VKIHGTGDGALAILTDLDGNTVRGGMIEGFALPSGTVLPADGAAITAGDTHTETTVETVDAGSHWVITVTISVIRASTGELIDQFKPVYRIPKKE